MQSFIWNLMLAFLWATLVGPVTLANILVGYLLSLFALWLARPRRGGDRYFRRLMPLLRFSLMFLKEITVSTIKIAVDVITPQVRSRPGVVAYRMDANSQLEIMLFATLLSFTPGTLVVDLSDDCETLYIHAMFLTDRDFFCERIKTSFERPLLEVLR